ncbi:MAG: ABC transporter ATP-binding protein [Betaproteobacteria bacterium]
MADLKINSLHKYYGSMHAVKGVDLEIPKGEFTVLVGQSGCGKSTLLRTIAGLEEIDEGSIEIDGEVVNDVAPKDRDIAMVFQNYALYPYMTVFDNIAFGLRARKTPNAEIEAKVAEASRMLSIDHLLERYPRQLSGGQLQRVAIGRAIVRQARIYLFDEPLSNLDAQLRDEMRGEIKRLHRELGKTMIYVTHDQIEAMTMADRIVLLRDGKIEQQGSPLDLYERPATKYVAGFLGSPSMNFIDGIVTENKVTINNSNHSLDIPEQIKNKLTSYANKQIIVGIRPEHFSRADIANHQQHSKLSVNIELVQPTGSRSYVTFRLGQNSAVAELRPQDLLGHNTTIELSVDMSRVIYIDPITEMTI